MYDYNYWRDLWIKQHLIYPGDEGSKLKPSSRYENFIGGDWQKPKSGKYFENISPTSGKVICEVPRSNAEDIDFALDGT